jgi:hypothetical protein
MIAATDRHRRTRTFVLRYRLRSLLVVTAACAALLGLYANFGDTFILPLFLVAAAFLAVIWVIDSSLAIREILRGVLRSRRSDNDEETIRHEQRVATQETLVKNLQDCEQLATARYNGGVGPLEDVLRAKGVRLKAEIDQLRSSRLDS